MNYQIDYRSFKGIFAVPLQLRELLPGCEALALKVMLLILSEAAEPISSGRLASVLGATPNAVEEALSYWKTQGILTQIGEEAESSAAPRPKVRRISSRKILTNLEMEQLAVNDPNVSVLIHEAEAQVGRALSAPEREVLCSFYSFDNLSVEYLLLVLAYCVHMGKTNFGYFKKVVSNMLEKDIDSYDKAESYLDDFIRQMEYQSLVRSAFGIHDRSLSQKECDCIKTWFTDFGYDISVIRLAFEECINNTGKLSFPYIHKILSNWSTKGIRSAKEASLESSVQKKVIAAKKHNDGLASSFDMDDIQQLLERSNRY